jgi:hypothetical protein
MESATGELPHQYFEKLKIHIRVYADTVVPYLTLGKSGFTMVKSYSPPYNENPDLLFLREGPRNYGASWAFCGSGVLPYDFLNLYGVFNNRFRPRIGRGTAQPQEP